MKFRQIWSQRLLDRLQLAGIYKQQFCAKLDQLIVEGVYLVFSIQMECPNGSTLTIGLPRVVVSVPNIVMVFSSFCAINRKTSNFDDSRIQIPIDKLKAQTLTTTNWDRWFRTKMS